MKTIGFVTGLLCVSLMVGCAGSATQGEGVKNATSGESAHESSNAKTEQASQTDAETVGVKRECRTDIASYVKNVDGSFGVLTADKSLYRIDDKGVAARQKILADTPDNYSLLPFSNILIHRFPDRIMIEDISTGTELFKLQGDSKVNKVWYAQDYEEIAIQTVEDRYNIWNTQKKFDGVSMGETVQDFMNRQNPDHSLRYPGNVRAMALGKNGHVAVALDDPTTGKIGLLYHLDTVNAPGKLAVLARTNTPVKTIAISPSAAFVAAVDDAGAFYFVNTTGEKKGFIFFAKQFANVHDVVFWGNHPVVLQNDKTVVVDSQTGAVLSTIAESFDSCEVSGDSLVCAGNGYLTFVSIPAGTIEKRYAFHEDTYAVVSENRVEGTLNCQ